MSTTNTENIISLFSVGGKTMIGSFITNPSRGAVGSGANYNSQKSEETGIFTKLMGNTSGTITYNDFYFVKDPAEIVYSLNKQESGTAKLTWNIIPMVYGVLKQDNSKDLVNAYKEIIK